MFICLTKEHVLDQSSLPSFYLTTAIDYPNGLPHIGHAYEKVVTDCYARWYTLKGYDVKLTTGTDENGQKLVKSAQEEGTETLKFVDKNVIEFRKLCKDLNLSYTDFIRSTEQRHLHQVYKIWNALKETDNIYMDRYKGHYCISCESFYTETQFENNLCPVHHTELTYMEEDGYFFRLGKYKEWIIKYINEHPNFIYPFSIRKEILSRLESDDLNDLSISRPNNGWGIPVPDNDEHVIYTWFDALICYYSSSQVDEKNQERGHLQFWPADVHVIGKDISWFHTVIWPTMLKCAGIELPKQIFVHGMVLGHDGKRMSKSLGNGVSPQECLDLVPVDSFRFYMLKSISSGQDGPFSKEKLVSTHNTELANDFGNLLMRVIKLSLKNIGASIAASDEIDFKFQLFDKISKEMEEREHHKAITSIFSAIGELNAYLNKTEPWKIKDDKKLFHKIMYTSLINLNQISYLLVPFIPDSANKALVALGCKNGTFENGFENATFELMDLKPLFPKIDPL